ncbi:MAG: tetratricopeptide repeat protein, partial [Candidatus Dormibacteraeota bacterium]|nr:tetratricopeptide repeat protein [Candidatus Dormibacteraeota bacterium]
MIEDWALASAGVLMDEQPDAALPAFKIFERWAIAELGLDSPAVAQAIARQAWCEARLGHRAEACRLYRRALELLRETVGDQNNASKQISEFLASDCGEAALEGTPLPVEAAGPHTLEGLPRFNPLRFRGGDPLAGIEALEGRAEAAVRQLGIPSPGQPAPEEVEAQGYNLGKLMREIGEFEIAVEIFEDYERWASERYGPEDYYVFQTVHQLAYCYKRLGLFTDSCRLYQRAIDISRRREPENPYTKVLEANLEDWCPPMPERFQYGMAYWLIEGEQFSDAMGGAEIYEAWARREYGSEHRYVVEAITLRANCHEFLGEYQEACRLYRHVLASVQDGGFESIPVEGIEQFVEEHCGGFGDTAEEWARVPLGERWGSPTLAQVEPDLQSVGDVLMNVAHYDEAIAAYEAAQAWLEREQGPHSEGVAAVLASRAWCHT